MWGIPIVASALGLWGQPVFWIVVPLGLVWFVYLSVKSFGITCPQCRRSVFVRGYGWNAAWPARQCSKCDRDLTVR